MKISGSLIFIGMLLALVLCSSLGSSKYRIEGMQNKHHNKHHNKHEKSPDQYSQENPDYYSNILNSGSGPKAANQGSYQTSSNEVSDSKTHSQLGAPYTNKSPGGIPRHQIPEGNEDLYILKSEIVPPVCPACPTVMSCPSDKNKCQPCPPCARCPEPSFECKKVPNYNALKGSQVPKPILNDFSTFGM